MTSSNCDSTQLSCLQAVIGSSKQHVRILFSDNKPTLPEVWSQLHGFHSLAMSPHKRSFEMQSIIASPITSLFWQIIVLKLVSCVWPDIKDGNIDYDFAELRASLHHKSFQETVAKHRRADWPGTNCMLVTLARVITEPFISHPHGSAVIMARCQASEAAEFVYSQLAQACVDVWVQERVASALRYCAARGVPPVKNTAAGALQN